MEEKEKSIFNRMVGMKFSESRKRVNISQEEMGVKLDLSRTSIVNFEKGRQQLSPFLLWKASRIFHTTVDELLPNGEEMNMKNLEIKLSESHKNQLSESTFTLVEEFLRRLQKD